MVTKKAAAKKPAARKPAAKSKDASSIADMIVNQTEMAKILGVTPRWLRIMATEGNVPVEGRGKFLVGAVVQAYAAFLKEGATKKTGSTSMDALREEKAIDLRLNRARKDRELISLDEALGFFSEVTGQFVSYLSGLPAEITGVPRERQRLNEIIDKGRQRLADNLAKARANFKAGRETFDAEAEE